MISTIEKTLKVIDEKLCLVPKEYPNWYGIEDIGFIWHGAWADPEIEYKGRVVNSVIIEDSMWENFRDECHEQGKRADDCMDEFDEYMKEHASDVYELIELALGNQI